MYKMISSYWMTGLNKKLIELPDGKYYGVCLDNKIRNGLGKMEYKNGDIYEGHWENDKKHGEGEFTSENFTYRGVWFED